MKIWRNKEIEDITIQRLVEYQAKGFPLSGPPVPIEKVVMQVLCLTIVWENIEEKTGDGTILGGLRPEQRQIVLNEIHLPLFEDKPGLERSTTGHEGGHFDLYSDPGALANLKLPFDSLENIVAFRMGDEGPVQILKELMMDDETYKVFRETQKRKDSAEVKSAVDRYASALLMPKDLLEKVIIKEKLVEWRYLYDVKDQFQVTISNLTTRLQRLGWIYIDEENKLFLSKSERHGQIPIFR